MSPRRSETDRVNAWRKRHPEKLAAQLAVRSAIEKKQMVKPRICDRCWVEYRSRGELQAHHRDYSKPLQIVWLCRACHLEAHGRDGSALRARSAKAAPPTVCQVETMRVIASFDGPVATKRLQEVLVDGPARIRSHQGLWARLNRLAEDGYVHKDARRGTAGIARWSLTSKGWTAIPAPSEPEEGSK